MKRRFQGKLPECAVASSHTIASEMPVLCIVHSYNGLSKCRSSLVHRTKAGVRIPVRENHQGLSSATTDARVFYDDQ
jgi:hypothetical protein